MGCFSTLKRLKKTNVFHGAHIGYGSALWASWHFTCVSPSNRTNPCGPVTCAHWCIQTPVRGHLQSFGTACFWLCVSLGWGPTVLGHTYIPRLQSEGSRQPAKPHRLKHHPITHHRGRGPFTRGPFRTASLWALTP